MERRTRCHTLFNGVPFLGYDVRMSIVSEEEATALMGHPLLGLFWPLIHPDDLGAPALGNQVEADEPYDSDQGASEEDEGEEEPGDDIHPQVGPLKNHTGSFSCSSDYDVSCLSLSLSLPLSQEAGVPQGPTGAVSVPRADARELFDCLRLAPHIPLDATHHEIKTILAASKDPYAAVTILGFDCPIRWYQVSLPRCALQTVLMRA